MVWFEIEWIATCICRTWRCLSAQKLQRITQSNSSSSWYEWVIHREMIIDHPVPQQEYLNKHWDSFTGLLLLFPCFSSTPFLSSHFYFTLLSFSTLFTLKPKSPSSNQSWGWPDCLPSAFPPPSNKLSNVRLQKFRLLGKSDHLHKWSLWCFPFFPVWPERHLDKNIKHCECQRIMRIPIYHRECCFKWMFLSLTDLLRTLNSDLLISRLFGFASAHLS